MVSKTRAVGRLAILVPLLLMAAVDIAVGHGNPTLVTTDGLQLALVSPPHAAFMLDTGSGPATDDVGFGVNHPDFGPPYGTKLALETLGGLLYWDGQSVTPTNASVVLTAPLFDSDNLAVSSDIKSYEVAADSLPMSGMTWATYRGGYFWEAHGFAQFETEILPTGVYGIPARLTSPTLAPSDPFIVALGWNVGVLDRQTGALALQRLVATPTVTGDYNYDGFVTAEDYTAWKETFGIGVVVPGAGADGNSDGIVSLADYATWRDHYSGSAGLVASHSVPEPGGLLLAMAAVTLFTVHFASISPHS